MRVRRQPRPRSCPARVGPPATAAIGLARRVLGSAAASERPRYSGDDVGRWRSGEARSLSRGSSVAADFRRVAGQETPRIEPRFPPRSAPPAGVTSANLRLRFDRKAFRIAGGRHTLLRSSTGKARAFRCAITGAHRRGEDGGANAGPPVDGWADQSPKPSLRVVRRRAPAGAVRRPASSARPRSRPSSESAFRGNSFEQPRARQTPSRGRDHRLRPAGLKNCPSGHHPRWAGSRRDPRPSSQKPHQR